MNSNLSDIAAALTQSISKDGQTSFTANQPMGNNKLTGLAAGTLATDSVNLTQVETLIAAAVAAGIASVLPVGLVEDYIGATAPTGWVLGWGTIGDASSGATNRANADCENLFTLLWNNWADGQAAVSTGRGASAAADWAAHKTIAIPDLRGRVRAGNDNMGGSAASRLTGTTMTPDGNTLGATGGAQTITLTESQMPSHTHSVTDPGHTHQINADNAGLGGTGGGNSVWQDPGGITSVASVTSISLASTGGGTAHGNVQPAIIFSTIIKL